MNEELRRELYKDSGTEALYNLLGVKPRIVPSFDLVNGYSYPDLDRIAAQDGGESTELFLKKMLAARVLDKEIFDVELRCPKCRSPNVSTRYECPFCESLRIGKNLLVEHLGCGQTSTLSSLKEKSWFDFCPNCNKKYTEGGYRVVGKWFECSACGKQIKNPLVSHVCRGCGGKFSFDEAVQREVFSFSLSALVKEEVNAGVLFPSDIKGVFAGAGYSPVGNLVKGKSGIEHKFDYVFSNANKVVALDTLFSSVPVEEIEVIKEQSKIYDTGIEVFLLVAPKLSEGASVLAGAYKLKIVEASSRNGALGKLRKLVQ